MMGALLKYKPFLPYTASVSDCVLVYPQTPTEVPGVSDPAREHCRLWIYPCTPGSSTNVKTVGLPAEREASGGKNRLEVQKATTSEDHSHGFCPAGVTHRKHYSHSP